MAFVGWSAVRIDRGKSQIAWVDAPDKGLFRSVAGAVLQGCQTQISPFVLSDTVEKSRARRCGVGCFGLDSLSSVSSLVVR